MEQPSRIGAARRSLRIARAAVGVAAAAGFAVFALAARAAHPGRATGSTAATRDRDRGDDTADSGAFDFGSASIGPSAGAAPRAQGGGS